MRLAPPCCFAATNQSTASHPRAAGAGAGGMGSCQCAGGGACSSGGWVATRVAGPADLADLAACCLQGVMLAVWEGTVAGQPLGIVFCLAGLFSSGAMVTFSSEWPGAEGGGGGGFALVREACLGGGKPGCGLRGNR